MNRPKPVLVVDNHLKKGPVPEGLIAVCVVSLESIGKTTGLFGSETAGAAAADFASRLEALLRRDDQLIQINESKYCLLIRNLQDRNHALLAGIKLERLFEEPFVHGDYTIHHQVHAGIAQGVSEDNDAETLFRSAETARETARAGHKVFELADQLDEADIHRRWRLNEEVDEALYQHQLKLYYQPKVTAREQRLCGAEGLVRWDHPAGLLAPGQFLPYLEPEKLLALTRHLVRQCIRDLAADPWLPPLSINLDPQLLSDHSVVRLILDELTLWDVDASRLVVEVTENGIMDKLDGLLGDFTDLRARGVRISLDDFGTGHSSLAQFRDLPVDELKIDRSFVSGLETDAANRYLTRLIVDLGHYFDMKVVAEGVETRAVAEALRQIDCDLLQGFYFSPPLPLQEFTRWAASRPA